MALAKEDPKGDILQRRRSVPGSRRVLQSGGDNDEINDDKDGDDDGQKDTCPHNSPRKFPNANVQRNLGEGPGVGSNPQVQPHQKAVPCYIWFFRHLKTHS